MIFLQQNSENGSKTDLSEFKTHLTKDSDASGSHRTSTVIGVSGELMGCHMNNGIATYHLPDEYFVLQIDGRVKSGHRRFIDALRAALRLKQEFPQHDIKVHAIHARTQAAETMH